MTTTNLTAFSADELKSMLVTAIVARDRHVRRGEHRIAKAFNDLAEAIDDERIDRPGQERRARAGVEMALADLTEDEQRQELADLDDAAEWTSDLSPDPDADLVDGAEWLGDEDDEDE